jgi:DNA-binding MarR family transcriptional regulator
MTPNPPLSEMPGHLIRRLNQHSTAVFLNRLKDLGHDITPVQFSALVTLADHPGLDQATLAGLIAYDRATIGGVVKRLQQKKLIRRETNDHDRRAFRLMLTPAGQALVEHLGPVVVSLQDDIVSRLTESERVTFVKLMQKALHMNASADL